MIHVIVKPYCESCSEFEPETDRLWANDQCYETAIRCTHRYLCEEIENHIRNELKKENSND